LSDRTLLVFGAGNIGLSFVGQVFARSGYRLVVADIESSIIARINRHRRYCVQSFAPDGTSEMLTIEPVTAIGATDTEAIRAVLAASDRLPLLATAVGRHAFPDVLRTLRESLPRRIQLPSLDVITAENIHEPGALAAQVLGRESPSIHAASVGKMVPVQKSEWDIDGPLTIRAEAFNTLYVDGIGWAGPPPADVDDVVLVDDIGAWMDRKLYVHNLGHSTCAWVARALSPSIPTIAQAMADPGISALTDETMRIAAGVVEAAHSDTFTADDLGVHVDDLLHRFANPGLVDTVERVGRDLTRKLARDERIAGCLLTAATHRPDALPLLARVYTTALRFGVPGVSTDDGDLRVTASESPTTIRELSALDPRRSPADRSVLKALATAESFG
jgi:mannitol-1-phosphate 5-dehydrogenase